ncbi:MAG TPA: hypothetical protein VKE22_12640, partial [Haliangiales bacterium]|nr:hypothetical protein [Haliangiales bacterium]
APHEPLSAELPPLDDGHNWGERAFTQAEREALAKMDPERFGHMAEGPGSASAAEHQPAARPADEPAAAFHEKDAMRLEGEEEYLRQENEAAERARAARAAAATPATPATAEEPPPVTQRSPVGPEHLPAREPQVEVVQKPASPADTERAPAIKVPREEHYWGPVMPEGEPGLAPESATPSQEASTEMAPTEMAPTELSPSQAAPTRMPPTEMPPTEAAPTRMPPTEMPPTEMPPTEMPPTEMPPTEKAGPKLDEQAPDWWGKQQKSSAKAMRQLPELPAGTLESFSSEEIGKGIVDRVAAMRERTPVPGAGESGLSGPELRKAAELCMFFKDTMFEKILENGFLNSHEVGSSGGGVTDNEGRAQQENRLAGMRLEEGYQGGRTALNEVRPKYAILNVGLDENLGAPAKRANTEAYGNVQAVMGEHMFDRSTFTNGDTYGGSINDESTLPQTFKDGHTRLKMDGGYFEGQMWGKVTTNDVAEYRVRPGTDPEVVAKLAATGKPVYELRTDDKTGREVYSRGRRLDAREAPPAGAAGAVDKPADAPAGADETPSHIAVTHDGEAVHP